MRVQEFIIGQQYRSGSLLLGEYKGVTKRRFAEFHTFVDENNINNEILVSEVHNFTIESCKHKIFNEQVKEIVGKK